MQRALLTTSLRESRRLSRASTADAHAYAASLFLQDMHDSLKLNVGALAVQAQLQRERQQEVDRENRHLLNRMEKIESKPYNKCITSHAYLSTL